MDIQARQKGEVIILDLYGRLDADAAALIETVGQCLREGCGDILLNFENVESIDYLGISALILAAKEVLNAKGRLKCVHVPAHLKGFFSIAGLQNTMEIYPSENSAVASFREDVVIENIKKMRLRRRFKRLPIEMKVEISPKFGGPAAGVTGEILNLSGVGAYIYGCRQFKLGDQVILKLKLAPKNEDIEIEGRVVWLPGKEVQPYLRPGIGVEFFQIPASDQRKLLAFIERNLS